MQWLKRRWVPFGMIGALACSGDPTGNESTPTDITANPEVVFVTQGQSQPVIVSVVDEDGQVLQADFGKPTNVGSGIKVTLDTNFQTTTTGVPIHRQARYFVEGVDLAHSSFTVEALGLTKTIEVFSVPGALNATISNPTPALGDTISITAPAGTFFTDSSLLTFGGYPPFVVSRDETTITFIPFPNITAPALVSNVGVESNPDVVFEIATPDTVRTDSIFDIGGGVSNTTPDLGAEVTLTLPAGLRLIPESLATLNVAGAPLFPRGRHLSADSSTIFFVPPPSSDSFVVVSGVIPARLGECCTATRIIGLDTIPGYALTLATTARLTTEAVTVFPSTVSNGAPAANTEITLNSTDPDFTISDTAQVLIGALPAAVTGRTANSITFVPPPSSSGGLTVNGVLRGGFSLSLPSTSDTVATGALAAPLSGTTGQSNAPQLDVPGAGDAKAIWDTPDFLAASDTVATLLDGGGSAFYKIVIPADGDYTISTDWTLGTELDQYLCATPIDEAELSNCDDTAAVGDKPATATYSLTAGTYFLIINDFEGDAAGAAISITIAR